MRCSSASRIIRVPSLLRKGDSRDVEEIQLGHFLCGLTSGSILLIVPPETNSLVYTQT